ncbi:hypothetical protein [Rhodoferax sp. UBA5149]|uniref:hypothetical protein n=1 Tax=Rhodoferax sp. UBA5149 TaxID=1947379 RepID=UPI0025F709AD|nr:hypothetical protein [Rhodoferax sp. UBA5149]
MTMVSHFLYEVFQFLAVFSMVAGCTVYCLLTLAPDALKRPLKLALLRCPLPAFISSRLQQTDAKGACGSSCGACSSGPATIQAVKWHGRKL